jgi:hypothetical protein
MPPPQDTPPFISSAPPFISGTFEGISSVEFLFFFLEYGPQQYLFHRGQVDFIFFSLFCVAVDPKDQVLAPKMVSKFHQLRDGIILIDRPGTPLGTGPKKFARRLLHGIGRTAEIQNQRTKVAHRL